MNAPFKYDLFITYENDQQERVKQFAEKLKDKNWRIFYNDSVFQSNTSPGKCQQLMNSASMLAIVTKKFLKSRSCIDETSFAIRNKIPMNVIMERDVDLKENPNELTQMMQRIPTSEIGYDLTVLDKPINSNSEIYTKIDSKLSLGFKNVRLAVYNLFHGKMDNIQMWVSARK